MKYKRDFKTDVREVCKRLRWEFFVHEWTMDIVWMDQDDEKDENKKTAASIPMNPRYLAFKINIFPVLQEIWSEDKSKFLEILVHEFSHHLTEPLYDVAINAISNREAEHLEDIRERQTQRITNIIFPHLEKKLIKSYGSNKPRCNRRKTTKRLRRR